MIISCTAASSFPPQARSIPPGKEQTLLQSPSLAMIEGRDTLSSPLPSWSPCPCLTHTEGAMGDEGNLHGPGKHQGEKWLGKEVYCLTRGSFRSQPHGASLAL